MGFLELLTLCSGEVAFVDSAEVVDASCLAALLQGVASFRMLVFIGLAGLRFHDCAFVLFHDG